MLLTNENLSIHRLKASDVIFEKPLYLSRFCKIPPKIKAINYYFDSEGKVLNNIDRFINHLESLEVDSLVNLERIYLVGLIIAQNMPITAKNCYTYEIF
jgi:hypothetical protein